MDIITSQTFFILETIIWCLETYNIIKLHLKESFDVDNCY